MSLSSKVPKNGCKRLLYDIYDVIYRVYLVDLLRVRSSTWVEISKEVAYSCEISTFVLKLTEKSKVIFELIQQVKTVEYGKIIYDIF